MTIPIWVAQKSELIIDSNLLVVVVIGRARGTLLGRKPAEGFHLSDFERLAEFTSLFKKVTTTPYILSEVNSLLNKTGYARRECRAALASQVESMDEYQNPSNTLTRDNSFEEFGLTDIGIKYAATDDTLVLTEDEDLIGLLTQSGIAAIRYKDIFDAE
jgi:hypothetical protein